ncbi:hypothetical protein [Aquimarina brevivitae]|uniref:Calx-beta domain-containing protein n=1 Tax=Aquimarina brevivitae TaxID=323412 RepID=A0A4Q7P1M0_9FLAO|nr:hypothetical protein [Aquimarina brevivitae]RZS93614.1 hypothetical protein EV197_2194 [Aquimarina brevivitae]
MKKFLHVLMTFVIASAGVVVSLHLMASSKDDDPTSYVIKGTWTFSHEVKIGEERYITLADNVIFALNNTQETDWSGVLDETKIDELEVTFKQYFGDDQEIKNTIVLYETGINTKNFESLPLSIVNESGDLSGDISVLFRRLNLTEAEIIVENPLDWVGFIDAESERNEWNVFRDNQSTTATGTVTADAERKVGQDISFTLTDSDLNTDPDATDTYTITLTSDKGETEELSLTESGAATGSFEGMVNTAYGTAAGTNNDGAFNVEAGTVITITYEDAANSSGEAVTLTQTVTLTGGTTGSLIISTPNPKVGDNITLQVTDSDVNTDDNTQQSLQLTLTSGFNETETVTLTETGAATGVFEGSVSTVYATAAGTNNDGSFNAQAGTTITAVYTDECNAQGGTTAFDDTITLAGGVTGTITITNPAEVGNNLTVRVTDNDLNTNTGTQETVSIVVSSSLGESETIVLTETTSSSGVFEGAFDTIEGTNAGTDNDGTLNATDGTVVTATYDDTFDVNGADPAAVEASVTLTGGGPGLTFDNFVDKKVEGTRTIVYNGSTTDSGVNSDEDITAQPYYCYGLDYEIYKANGDLEVWNNNSLDPDDPNHCNMGSSLTFTISWATVDADTISIDNGGTENQIWDVEIMSDTEFNIRTLQGGVQLVVRYFQVVP